MKSRIQISVSEAMEPCIKVNYEESDDARDLLVRKFQEALTYKNGMESCLAEVHFHPNGEGFMILPISEKTERAYKGLFKEKNEGIFVVCPICQQVSTNDIQGCPRCGNKEFIRK